ncbi:hypothetical protein LWF15_01335 [Kineosporia rhizophila]|uniref:hypothetical protein n=1 Tax=Kineosporia rhizophila TaxID=84633 RepID=UPI001E538295|nr:hypothetical protein [Kineosporia rhizophila]MCE0534141.1 hypothetical protein [Kineosporia rhizophila]
MSIEPATPVSQGSPSANSHPDSAVTDWAIRLFAVLRLSVGFVFLWAALDKTFGLGYSSSGEKAWVNGNSPTKGFLSFVDQGPFASVFNDLAGLAVVDILFMVGMFAVGVALIAGVAMNVAAVSGALIMVLMWAAEWPMAQSTNAGEPTGSTNPFMDYHIVYALVLFALVAVHAGRVWGLGRTWEQLPVVKNRKWMH